MTTEERFNIIKNKANRDRQEKIDKETAVKNRRKDLMEQIKEISDRIQDIIALANSCNENSVKIPEDRYDKESGAKYGYPHEFIAEGICHHVGLIRTWGLYGSGTYQFIGIVNGGCCGQYDFWTNGYRSFGRHEETHIETEPRISDLEHFLKEYPSFEKAFLNWIDSLA